MAVKNKISDLRDTLFEQLERLNDESISPIELEMELKKADMIQKVAQTIVNASKVEVDFVRVSGMKTQNRFFNTEETKLLG
jgi:hypothetical protein